MLTYLEYVTKNVDKGAPVDAIYVEFNKAFDSVPHERPLMNMGSVEINSKTVDWVEDWLSSRKQRVVLRWTSSNWQPVTSCVSHSSVLGPLMFPIYINNIDEGMEGQIIKFANNTKLYRAMRSEQDADALQKDIEKIEQWSRKQQMSFNSSK